DRPLSSGGGGGGGGGGGWREAKQGRQRIETQQQQRNRGDQKKGLLATLNSKGPFHGSRVERAAAARSRLSSGGYELTRKSRDYRGTLDNKANASASSSSPANIGGGPPRPTPPLSSSANNKPGD
ncbi:unnamed protein product, partial [Laminaria digitata]